MINNETLQFSLLPETPYRTDIVIYDNTPKLTVSVEDTKSTYEYKSVLKTLNNTRNKNINNLIFFVSITKESATTKENALISEANQAAKDLAKILNQLKQYNRGAVYSIASMIEPYMGMEADQESYLHIPPKSSRRITINPISRGKAKPRL